MPPERQGFTNQQRRIMTEKEFNAKWHGDGSKLHCTLCNHRFQVGEGWRWVYANNQNPSYGNFEVCDKCDGPDVMTRYQAACVLLHESMKDRGEGHWPVDLAARLLKAETLLRDIAIRDDDHGFPDRCLICGSHYRSYIEGDRWKAGIHHEPDCMID